VAVGQRSLSGFPARKIELIKPSQSLLAVPRNIMDGA